MRYKEFFVRTGFFLPLAIFAIFIFMMAFGMISGIFGADNVFYCSMYCKIGLSLLIVVLPTIVFCQAKACWKKDKKLT